MINLEPPSAAGWATRHGWILVILLPGIWALLARPIAPLDETRALGVAWEMWLRGDFLVPFINGEPYSHKPPLLLWLIQMGWAVFGVNDWWPRLISPLAMLGATLLTGQLATELWPEDRNVRLRTYWLLAGSLGWLVISQMLLYDPLLTTCVLVAMLGLWRASTRGRPFDWALLACGIGLGILTKGPVLMVHVVVPALLGPVWCLHARQRPWAWYGAVLLAVAGGMLIAGAWAIPAALRGGDEYAHAILLGQTAGRLVKSFAHARPWWVYLVFMPGLVLPWVLMPATWKGLFRGYARSGNGFLLAWLGGSLMAFSLISGKQPHYIIPEIAPAVLLIAASLPASIRPGQLAFRAILFAAVLLIAATISLPHYRDEFNMVPPGQLTKRLQEQGAPVAVMQRYHNQLFFPGRLEQPLAELEEGEQHAWFREHPDGVVITFGRDVPGVAGLEVFASFPYRGEILEFRRLANNVEGDAASGEKG